ncbi:MAG: FMN-binding protein, partial [Synergistaceae bacterium]|nr:FMN-binding protein [Synergistaceae bacterium]
MKKLFCFVLVVCMMFTSACARAFNPGTYEGEGKGYSEGAPVKVKVTVDADKITAVEIDAPEEQPFGVPNFPKYIEALIGRADGNIDAISNATMSRNGIAEAVNKALAAASKEAKTGFNPGTYEGEGKGYSEGAPVKVKVTVDADKITAVEIDAPEEQPFGVPNFPKYIEALIGRA